VIGLRSGLVILARLRPEFAPPGHPPEVHAYPVAADTLGESAVLTAPCGHILKPGKGERAAMFVGTPCIPCLLFTMGHDNGVADAAWASPELPAPVEPEPRLDAATDSGRYAVGLRGDQVRHLVADDAIRSMLDDRDVVHTVCGHLGWGPLETAPDRWPICPDCAKVSGVVA
jgi:hypothetical protein